MYIQGQDRDIIFTISDKGPLKGRIYTEDKIIKDKFYGTNVFGKTLFKKHLLGTYETEEAEQIVAEIYTLLKAGKKFYAMPEPSIDPEDWGVELQV